MLTSQRVYDLVLLTTGDADQADRARAEFMSENLKRNIPWEQWL